MWKYEGKDFDETLAEVRDINDCCNIDASEVELKQVVSFLLKHSAAARPRGSSRVKMLIEYWRDLRKANNKGDSDG